MTFKKKNTNVEKPACNGCHDTKMMCYQLKNIAIFYLNVADCMCILWNMTYNQAFNLLNNLKLEKKSSV